MVCDLLFIVQSIQLDKKQTIMSVYRYNVAMPDDGTSPWNGMTPVECIQVLMFYIRCVLQGSGCDKWYAQLPGQTFKPPFAMANDDKVELFRTVLLALCTPTEPLSESQLTDFYSSAIIGTTLPYIMMYDKSPVSWFVKESNSGWWYSVFLYSERLHSQALSHDALYPLEYNSYRTEMDGQGGSVRSHWWSSHNVDVVPIQGNNHHAMMALDGIATLIKYIGTKGKLPCLHRQYSLLTDRTLCPMIMCVDGVPNAPGKI
jgi:hypothetical protein